MLDPVIQSAFVVIVAWLLTLAAKYFNFPLDDTTVFSIATAIVAFILSKLGMSITYRVFPSAVKNGFLKGE